MPVAVAHLKGRVTFGSFVIDSFIKPLIGEIVAIMDPGDDIVEFHFAFHEEVVFSFAVHVATINQGKGLKCVFDDRVDVWLW